MIVRAGTHRRLVGRAMGTVLGVASLASVLLAVPANANWQGDLQRQLRALACCRFGGHQLKLIRPSLRTPLGSDNRSSSVCV